MNTFNNAKADTLRRELGKLQCWLTGYHAGAGHRTGVIGVGIPGEDAVRQAQLFLEDLMREAAERTPVTEPEKPQPVAAADGWITHDGKGMPVDGLTEVTIKCRDGYEGADCDASFWYGGEEDWWTFGSPKNTGDEIIAYKVVKS
jgi:hypothetical protein